VAASFSRLSLSSLDGHTQPTTEDDRGQRTHTTTAYIMSNHSEWVVWSGVDRRCTVSREPYARPPFGLEAAATAEGGVRGGKENASICGLPMVDGNMEKGVEVLLVMDSAMVYVYVVCVCMVCRTMDSVVDEQEHRSFTVKRVRQFKRPKTNLRVPLVDR